MSMVSGFSRITRALGSRNYRLYATGNFLSLIGWWMQRVGVGWLTWQLTESATWLGAMACAELIPSMVFGMPAGALADRFDKLTVIRTAQFLAMGEAAVLAALTFAGITTVELLFALTLFAGIVSAFSQPARLSFIPSLVPAEDLSAALALNSSIFNLARFVGPAFAGIAILHGGVGAAFLGNAVSYLAFLTSLWLLRVPPEPPHEPSKRGLLGDMGEGMRYAGAHPGIGPALLLMLAISLLIRPLPELLPGFADNVFGRGADGLAWMTSMMGAGAFAGGLWLAQRGPLEGLTAATIISAIVFAVAILAFTATEMFPFALACIAVAGFATVAYGTGTQTLVQAAVHRTMRGRVLGIYGLIFRGAPALGALAMGAVADWHGLRPPVAAGAAVCLILLAWAYSRRRQLARELEAGS
ncbi:MAG: MFS transporter [Alphaproteobacteria bacterium]|nr:MFS transporter [Alphaproteobacteria bacterium]